MNSAPLDWMRASVTELVGQANMNNRELTSKIMLGLRSFAFELAQLSPGLELVHVQV